MNTLPRRIRMRDLRGRGVRGALVPTSLPRYRSRSQLFDRAVLRAYAPIQRRFPDALANLDVAVDTIPRMRLRADLTVLPDDIASDGAVPLGRVISAGVNRQGQPTRSRIVIFRKPIEQRCMGAEDTEELLHRVLVALVASYLNMPPSLIDKDCEL